MTKIFEGYSFSGAEVEYFYILNRHQEYEGVELRFLGSVDSVIIGVDHTERSDEIYYREYYEDTIIDGGTYKFNGIEDAYRFTDNYLSNSMVYVKHKLNNFLND